MSTQQLLPYRLTLGALALAAVLTQIIFVPLGASSYAASYPEVAHLQVPYTVALIIGLVGLEVALVAGWLLLAATGDQAMTSALMRQGVNIITAGLLFLLVVSGGVFFHAGSVENVGGPPMLFGLMLCLVLVPGVWVARRRFLATWDVARHSNAQGYASA